jgi:hypothetical protein
MLRKKPLMHILEKLDLRTFIVVLICLLASASFLPSLASAAPPTGPQGPVNGQGAINNNDAQAQNGHFSTGDNNNRTIRDVCGGTVDGQDEAVGIAIKIGCKGKGNPIADAAFAIIRILSDGVGLVIIGSIVYGGIQYTGSRGDPQSTAMAVNRIRSSLFALLLYIFGYAILNYLIPAGFLG